MSDRMAKWVFGIVGLLFCAILYTMVALSQDTRFIRREMGEKTHIIFPEESATVVVKTFEADDILNGYQSFLDTMDIQEMSYWGIQMKGYRYVGGDYIKPRPCAVGLHWYITRYRPHPCK